MSDFLERALDSARRAAKASGAIIKNRFGGDFEVEFKKFQDPVTEVDRACERQIREILFKDFPEIDVWGEELGRSDPLPARTAI